MTSSTSQYNPVYSQQQKEALHRLHESLVRAELRTALWRHPWAAKHLDHPRRPNPFALDVLLDQSISCEEWIQLSPQ